MKKIVKYIWSAFESTGVRLLYCGRIRSRRSFLFWNRYHIERDNDVRLAGSRIERTIFSITGKGNALLAEDVRIGSSSITIMGERNRIYLADSVYLGHVNIQIRGNDCAITIGHDSYFNGGRMVAAGKANYIEIGEECLFSDNIEIWASDTHDIYDEKGETINAPRPIRIGNKVWVGSGVVVLKGVTVGDGAVIGMGTMVTGDVEARCVVVNSMEMKTVRRNVEWNWKE